MKKLQEAIEKKELSIFLIGDKDYRCHGRSDMNEPNDYLFCWEHEILPYMKINPDSFQDVFINSLIELLHYKKDQILGIYSVANHISWCSYFANKGCFEQEIYLKDVISKLNKVVDLNKNDLRNDKRWAGAEWNSNQGLLEPISRLLKKLTI